MRLVTFNILHGRSTEDGVVDLERLATAVRTLDPDVLGLQEVDRDQPRSHRADLTAVAAAAMGAVDHRFAAALTGTPGVAQTGVRDADAPGTPAYGVALLSRYPVRSWQTLVLPRLPFRVPHYRRHPTRFAWRDEEPRVALVGRLDTPDGAVTMVNTHLSFLPGAGPYQLRHLRRRLAVDADPVVLMGDLNLTGRRPEALTGYRDLARLATFPVDQPTRQLDHILLRGRLGSVVSTDAPRLPLSDHRALVVDLEL